MLTSGTALWYASRATGVVSLVLLTAVVVLGILVSRQARLPGLPRFAGLGLHRYLSMLAVGFVAVHVLTAITDSYVSIGLVAVIIPFTSAYQPLWLGLGAVSLDLIVAIIITSLLRHRIGRRPWRAVHWLAYASWPVALAHGLGSGTDLRAGPLLGLTVACTAAVAVAVGWRAAAALRSVPRARRVSELLAAADLAGGPQASGSSGRAAHDLIRTGDR
jgi:methionine sulfoxide reductase heme-binding subunit